MKIWVIFMRATNNAPVVTWNIMDVISCTMEEVTSQNINNVQKKIQEFYNETMRTSYSRQIVYVEQTASLQWNNITGDMNA